MKAAYIQEPGPADNIIVGDLPMPTLQPNQVLVKVEAVTVDPVDTYIRAGTYKLQLSFPFIIGRDMTGVVTQVGAGVTCFQPGDSVWCNNQGYAGRQGTFAEYVAIDEDLLYAVPADTDAFNLVASVHSALTAYVGLVARAQLAEGERIFINGGSGNVGNCAIQLARHLGARVAVTAGSPEKSEWCRQSGADCVIDYRKDDISARLADFAPGGVDVYWDLTQKPDVQKAVSLVAGRGRILLSSGLKHTCELSIGSFYTHNCTMFGFTITDLSVEELRLYAEELNRLFQQNVFSARIAERMPLDQSAAAHRLVDGGKVDGKVLVLVSPAGDRI